MNDDNRGWPEHIAYGGYFSLLPHDGFRACTVPALRGRGLGRQGRGAQPAGLALRRPLRRGGSRGDRSPAWPTARTPRPYPGMEKLPPNVVVGFCAFSHPASLYYKDTFEQYEHVGAQLGRADSHGNLAFWQHYLASNRDEENVGMPEHTPEMYARVVRVMAKYGNHVFCEMMADSIMFELFNRYLLMKLFYDPTLDEREICSATTCCTFYGPQAGPLLAEIYADINAKCIERFRSKSAAYSIWERLFSEAAMRDYQDKADRALKAGGRHAVRAGRGRVQELLPRPDGARPGPLRRSADAPAGHRPPGPRPALGPFPEIVADLPHPAGKDATAAATSSVKGQTVQASSTSSTDFEAAMQRRYVALQGRQIMPRRSTPGCGSVSRAATRRAVPGHRRGRRMRPIAPGQRGQGAGASAGGSTSSRTCKAARAGLPMGLVAETGAGRVGRRGFLGMAGAARGPRLRRPRGGPFPARSTARKRPATTCGLSNWPSRTTSGRPFSDWATRAGNSSTIRCWPRHATASACRTSAVDGPGLQARVNLGELLCEQKRYDDAVACMHVPRCEEGTWARSMLIGTAKVHLAAGRKPQAVTALKQALATVGIMRHQKTECESLLALP